MPIALAANVSICEVWDISQLSARPTLLRMKLLLFILRNTIRPLVKPKKPKLNSDIKTMLANVRPNCGNVLLVAVAIRVLNLLMKIKVLEDN
jgi:hypothetical protein